jgi:hypothetical protein
MPVKRIGALIAVKRVCFIRRGAAWAVAAVQMQRKDRG